MSDTQGITDMTFGDIMLTSIRFIKPHKIFMGDLPTQIRRDSSK